MTALLTVRDLRVEARVAAGRQVLLDGVDLTVERRDVVGIIGESGSGKTTLVRSLIGLLDRNVETTQGEIRFGAEQVFTPARDRRASVRGRHIGMIFQSASASLNPVIRIGGALHEVLRAHRPELDRAEAQRRIVETLRSMRLKDPEAVMRRYPHELSGGMRQRIAIALAIVTEPELVIADESTSALDVTTQAQVVSLLRRLPDELGSALLFVTHDLYLASELCSRLVVLYGGQVVELGETASVLERPRHPYTRALLDALPGWRQQGPLSGIPGAPPQVTSDWPGCRFAPRCSVAVDACRVGVVPWFGSALGAGHRCLVQAKDEGMAHAVVTSAAYPSSHLA